MKVKYYEHKVMGKLKEKLKSDEEMIQNISYTPDLFKNKYSFVSFCSYPKTNKLFIGTTNIFGDILIEFDIKTKTFRSCNYANQYWEPLECKIHKGLWLDEKEDALYFGTATLGNLSLTINSKGGKLSKYKIKEDKFEFLDSPIPSEFYQGTMYDPKLKYLYLLTNMTNGFGVYDIKNKKLLHHHAIGSIPHIGVIDNKSNVWCSYGVESQHFFSYNPETDSFTFPKNAKIPEGTKATNIMYMGAGPIDSSIKANNGMLYFGTALGALLEVDPQTGSVEYLGKPFPGNRLPGLALDAEGNILMCGGDDGVPYIAKFDIKTRTINTLGQVKATDGMTCFRCHEIISIENKIYVAETDNPERSAVLWEIEL